MGRITIELIRKRSEHNDGEISTLEELALHQEKLIRIENLDKYCRHLKVLLLQSNSIAKLENLSRLKCLEYLNLAMNNIEVIEGLEGCESLRKLDLTLNFVGQVSTVVVLNKNQFLEELYLTGNPCVEYDGYRNFVLSNVPHLRTLDGVEVTQTERIVARQLLSEVKPKVNWSEREHTRKRNTEKSMLLPDIDDENFWNITSPDTPEVRAQIHRKQEAEEAKKQNGGIQKKAPKLRTLFDATGRPFNINEGKYEFRLNDFERQGRIVLEIQIPKYMDTSLISLDLQPTYLRAIIKKKIFQLTLPDEVLPDQSTAQRSQTTGFMVISMPKLNQDGIICFPNKTDNSKSTDANFICATIEDYVPAKIEQEPTKVSHAAKGSYLENLSDVDESEVPPLI